MRTHARIDLERLAANYQKVRAAVGGSVTVLPVVKADAYGHGAVEVAGTLSAAGAGWFAVSCLEEGAALRLAGSFRRSTWPAFPGAVRTPAR